MAIENGYVADADEVNGFFHLVGSKIVYDNLYRRDFKDYAIKLLDDVFSTTTGLTYKQNEYYKGDAGSFTLQSYPIPLLSSNSKVSIYPIYEVYGLYDECDDSSVDTSKWIYISGDTATENTDYLEINNGVYRTADLSSEKLIVLNFNATLITSSSSGSITLKFSDGTNDIPIFSYSSQISFSGKIIIRLDWTNKRAIVYHKHTNNIHKSKTFNLSSLSTNLYLKFETSSSTSQSYFYIYNLRLGKTSPSTTITNSFSRDGSTFTNINGSIGFSSSGGDSIIVKSSGTVASGEVISIRDWGILEEV